MAKLEKFIQKVKKKRKDPKMMNDIALDLIMVERLAAAPQPNAPSLPSYESIDRALPLYSKVVKDG